MAKISDAFPSAFLSVEDLQGRNVNVQIATAAVEEVGKQKDTKIVLGLMGKKKKFVVNKTNAKTIAGLYGDDTDNWINQWITLCPREVEFQGDMVMAIRVSLQKPTGGAAPAPAPAPVPVTPKADDDIPF